MTPGRPFVHPLFDFGLIGGGLSLAVVALLVATGWSPSMAVLPVLIFLANLAHFAASTVRLYTKPRAFAEMPVLTYLLPLATFAVVSATVAFARPLGAQLNALYMTWSPFHYAAQTYGLATMYAMRSGARPPDGSQRWLWRVCMVPFAFAFCSGTASGVGWLAPSSLAPALAPVLGPLTRGLAALALAAPALLALHLARRGERGLPLISWLIVTTNAVWWVVFEALQAFVWATIFHGVQYLAIVTVFHLRDHPPGRGGAAWGAAKFYAMCLALGWLLFEAWPYFYVGAGFTLADSMLLCTAAINIHHFVVDRGIWRLRRDAGNRLLVGEPGSLAA